jgi:predicted ATP-dependent endonuclease of OLD family
LVGQNNTGKSGILRAIAWILNPSSLLASDFNDINQPVQVTARIDGISAELIDQIPHNQHQSAIRPYCESGSFWIRASATNGVRNIKREVADIGSPNGDECPTDWVAYPTGLPEAVSALLPEPIQINALEDIASDLGKATTGSVIKSLLEQIMAPILAEDEGLRAALLTIENRLCGIGEARSPHLNDFDQLATNSLKEFFPDLALDLSLQPLNAKDLFKSGDLHVTDRLTNDRRRFDELGAGAQRSLQMSMIRLLADAKRAETESISRTLLLVDEPELYLHPQGIRRIRKSLEKLSADRFQVVFSTHSPMMLNRDRAPDTVIISKQTGNGTIARHTLRKSAAVLQDHQAQSDVLYELGNLSEIYFSELVVLCEGKTDRRLIPLAYERFFDQSPSSELIAYVSVNGSPSII